MHPNLQPLAHDMALLPMSAEKYKTNRLTGVFAVPLRADTAARYAILSHLLPERCRRHPTASQLNKLSEEPGDTQLQSTVLAVGSWQTLLFSIQYTNGQTDRTEECASLLLDALMEPALEEEDFFLSQRKLLEQVERQQNSTRVYARQQCLSLLCPDHPYSVNPCGTIETIAALTPEDVIDAWTQLLYGARIRWIFQGGEDTDALTRQLETRFADIKERRAINLEHDISFVFKESQRTEYATVHPARLNLGFRIAAAEPNPTVMEARLMTALLNDLLKSLLPAENRETPSLCHTCAATYEPSQGVILVESGVEAARAGTVKEAILQQLDTLRQGTFESDAMEQARVHLNQELWAVEETQESREQYYAVQTVYDRYTAPAEQEWELQAVTREDIVRMARLVHLDTTYLLESSIEAAQTAPL